MIAAPMNAPQVHGRVSLATAVTANLFEVHPSMRRSTTKIVPSTVTRKMTWIVSRVGNIQVDSAIVMPRFEFWIVSQIVVDSGFIDRPLYTGA